MILQKSGLDAFGAEVFAECLQLVHVVLLVLPLLCSRLDLRHG
jgi:hypothetical protein